MHHTKRLLSVGHSYVVALNRRLAEEMARVGRGRWEVEVVAPKFFHGDLRRIRLEASEGDREVRLRSVHAIGSRSPHAFVYDPTLLSVVRSRRWDLVHCWEEPFVLAGAEVTLGARSSTPVVLATAQNLPKRYPPPFSWLERSVMRRAAGFVTYGKTVDDALHRRPSFRAGTPTRFIPMGVDTELFRPSAAARANVWSDLGWGDGPPVVGYLGRFIEAKGVPLMMRVLDRLRSDWRALFVGGGPLESELRRWAARTPERIKVVTQVPHDRVPGFLNAMDVLCAPSQTTGKWVEQFGRMIAEAYACGVPVVGSDSGEVPHTVGSAGFVVGERDEGAWVETLERLLSDAALRRARGEQARSVAQSRYAWPVIAGAHLEFFDEVLETSK